MEDKWYQLFKDVDASDLHFRACSVTSVHLVGFGFVFVFCSLGQRKC